MYSKNEINYQVVENVLFVKQFKAKVPSKFKKFVISIGFLIAVVIAGSVLNILSSEFAVADSMALDKYTADFSSYSIIDKDGTITKLSRIEDRGVYESIQIGDFVTQFPIVKTEDKAKWIELLVNEKDAELSIREEEARAKIVSILGSEERTDLVIKYSRRYNIPVYLVIGVIFAESSNKAYAISRVGARGLMQLMPDTAIYIARQFGLSATALEIRQNPSILNRDENLNIWFGCVHLRDLYNQIGTWEGAVHAYNQGYSRYMRGYRSNNYQRNVFAFKEYFENK